MATYQRHPIRFGSNGNGFHDDDDDDFRPRKKRRRGFLSFLTDEESDIAKRVTASVIVLAIGAYIFKLNDRISSLEMEFAIFKVRHELKTAQVPSVVEEQPGVWASPELTIIPNFIRDYFGVRPTPLMNRRKHK